MGDVGRESFESPCALTQSIVQYLPRIIYTLFISVLFLDVAYHPFPTIIFTGNKVAVAENFHEVRMICSRPSVPSSHPSPPSLNNEGGLLWNGTIGHHEHKGGF